MSCDRLITDPAEFLQVLGAPPLVYSEVANLNPNVQYLSRGVRFVMFDFLYLKPRPEAGKVKIPIGSNYMDCIGFIGPVDPQLRIYRIRRQYLGRLCEMVRYVLQEEFWA